MRGNPGGFPVTAGVGRKPWGVTRPLISSSSSSPSGLSHCWVLLCPFPKGVLQLDEPLAGFPHPRMWHAGLG